MRASSEKASVPSPDPQFRPSGFFVARSPLLSFDILISWAAGVRAAAECDGPGMSAAVAHDRGLLRARLQSILDRPEVRDALFVASPDVHEAKEMWRRDPESKKGRRAEVALIRYVVRMASRATPFGLFSGWSVGAIGETTRLVLRGQEANRRHSRLDNDYLFELAGHLDRDPGLRSSLVYRPNTSLYQTAGRHRYAEARTGDSGRHHYLVAVDGSEFLDATLRRAADGARRQDLAAALVADDAEGEVTMEDALAFVDSLIDVQILVSDLTPCVTGPEPLADMIAQLRQHPAGAPCAAALEGAREALARIDVAAPGEAAQGYREVASAVMAIRPSADVRRLFQVDLSKEATELTLGAAVVEDLLGAIRVLQRVTPAYEREGLERFRTAFVERYGEGREVALVDALDEEVGLGFQGKAAAADGSPLLAGLRLEAPGTDRPVPWGRRETLMTRKLETAIASGVTEVILDESDVAFMAAPQAAPLPAAFAAFAVLGSRAGDDPAQFQMFLRLVSGPSGARFFGRFCHADERLREAVERHLRSEEALAPEAIFAEVVHLPQGRTGNILCRPVQRAYEIPFLGRSGAPAERQIPVTDLRVTVSGSRIVLRSARLNRELIPRLTSMHAFSVRALGMYQFLCELQGQGVAEALRWEWGALESASFLPRLRYGRVVLARARWSVTRKEIQTLSADTVDERFLAVQRWRAKRRLPRYVVLVDSDNELSVDLDNVLAVESFLDLVRRRPQVSLVELFPEPQEMCAHGPEGRFVHELVIPFVRADAVASAPERAGETPVPRLVQRAALPRRSFPPGSDWLYAKLYTGPATADRILRESLTPLIREVAAGGHIESWFFLRYADPEWHLRIRFQGHPERLRSEVLPRLQASAEPLLRDGSLWRLQLDTYERELERYGGPEGIALCERAFQLDSEAVLSILEGGAGDEGTDARWRLALVGADLLLKDFGLDIPTRLAFVERLRDAHRARYRKNGLKHAMGDRFRTHRKELEALVSSSRPLDAPALDHGMAALRTRGENLAPLVATLRQGHEKGRISRSPEELASSFVHMHVNRMMRAAANEHEFVFYDFLARLYESRLARGRSTSPVTGMASAS